MPVRGKVLNWGLPSARSKRPPGRPRLKVQAWRKHLSLLFGAVHTVDDESSCLLSRPGEENLPAAGAADNDEIL